MTKNCLLEDGMLCLEGEKVTLQQADGENSSCRWILV